MKFAHLATKLFNVPLALHPAKAEIVMAALSERLGISRVLLDGAPLQPTADMFGDDDEAAVRKPYCLMDGVACVPVSGTLVQKLHSITPFSGMTGYDGIRAQLAMALEDDQVEAILLDIDSPGGEVSGCFDLVDEIYAARGQKPIWAVLNESAYSAAYAIASAADRIIVPRTGGTGSIGVIAMLVDLSKALEREGITVNIIQFGARKADGNEFAVLPKEARARFQAEIDTMGELFIETVARNRALSLRAVRAQEATTYLGADGVAAGLADAVMAPDAAFRALRDTLA